MGENMNIKRLTDMIDAVLDMGLDKDTEDEIVGSIHRGLMKLI